MSLDHFEGFDREMFFHEILREAAESCPKIKSSVVKKIIGKVRPDFVDGLFEIRPCIRKLKYIGTGENVFEAHEFFEVGEIYESSTYNGGTYSINGWGRRIGSNYFERVS